MDAFPAGSLPVRGAWIEIVDRLPANIKKLSLPVRGAWIEISLTVTFGVIRMSLPVRGAWIEMTGSVDCAPAESVAPRKGSVD